MANSLAARVPSGRSRTVLAPTIMVLRRHYLALGDVCVESSARSARIRDEAGAVRAEAQSLRGESARGRASRDVRHRARCPQAEAERFGWQLAELIADAKRLEPGVR